MDIKNEELENSLNQFKECAAAQGYETFVLATDMNGGRILESVQMSVDTMCFSQFHLIRESRDEDMAKGVIRSAAGALLCLRDEEISEKELEKIYKELGLKLD